MARKETEVWKGDFRIKTLDSKQFLKDVCACSRIDWREDHWNGGQANSKPGDRKVIDSTIGNTHLKPEKYQN